MKLTNPTNNQQAGMARAAKRKAKADAARIQRLYGERCSGIQINVMDIGKVFKVAERAMADSDISDNDLGDLIAAYVNEIRVN